MILYIRLTKYNNKEILRLKKYNNTLYALKTFLEIKLCGLVIGWMSEAKVPVAVSLRWVTLLSGNKDEESQVWVSGQSLGNMRTGFKRAQDYTLRVP